jgi:hypothetical protein
MADAEELATQLDEALSRITDLEAEVEELQDRLEDENAEPLPIGVSRDENGQINVACACGWTSYGFGRNPEAGEKALATHVAAHASRPAPSDS